MHKNEILKKARQILEIRNNENIHINTCVKADICPECGENLVKREATILEYKNESVRSVVECTKDIKHYQIKEYFYDNNDDD